MASAVVSAEANVGLLASIAGCGGVAEFALCHTQEGHVVVGVVHGQHCEASRAQPHRMTVVPRAVANVLCAVTGHNAPVMEH